VGLILNCLLSHHFFCLPGLVGVLDQNQSRINLLCSSQAWLKPPPQLLSPHPPVPIRECKLNVPLPSALDQQLIRTSLNQPDDFMVATNVSRKGLATLKQGEWLIDEIIDGTMALYNRREQQRSILSKGIKSYCFPSYLCTGLLHIDPTGKKRVGPNDYDYRYVSTWSKHAPGNLDTLDKIVFPLNIGNEHWVCMVAYPQKATIYFLDSLVYCTTSSQHMYLHHILHYLKDEFFRVHGRHDKRPWKLVSCDKSTTPQQPNTHDCGVYVCLAVDRLMQDLPLTFTSDDARIARWHIARAILTGEPPSW
jgi:Ulp1 family protease